MMQRLMIVVVLTLGISGAHGSCYGGPPSLDFDTGEIYCHDPMSEEDIPIDSYRVTSQCFNCTCTASGYGCCGVGVKAGVMSPPEGYVAVEGPDCKVEFQQAED